MKAPLEKVIENPSHSITTITLEEPYFDPNWHFHPHFQLFIVIKGKGTRLIGDSIQHFEEGDAVLLGPNVPHLWRCDEVYFQNNPQLMTAGIVTYFTSDFLKKSCSQLPEADRINKLLRNSERGIIFSGQAQRILIDGLKNLTQTKGFHSILGLLGILNELSLSSEYDFITSLGYKNTHKVSETERMHKVFDFVMKNYSDHIKLKTIADLASMSTPAFCRYFKKRTHKTFSQFIAEVRIGKACKMISENQDLSISEVSYANGFNTLSNFNRVFKELKNCTPSEYKNTMPKT